MKRLTMTIVATVVLLIGATGALAENTDRVVTPIMPGQAPGQMYSRADLHPQPEVRPTNMPSPVTTPAPVATSSLARGPVSNIVGPAVFSDSSVAGGSLMTPRGGAMSSPKMKADREIRRVIKRLG